MLVVDDDDTVREVLRRYLSRDGHEVLEAADGPTGLERARTGHPDLVVLDLMLPGMNGLDVCRELRADPRLRRLRILMLSAKGRESEVEKGLGLGADAYVTKPFSTRELVARVRQLLGGEA